MARYRREYPRVAIELLVELHLAEHRVVYAQSVDLSLAGIQLLCDRVTRDIVFPQGQPDGPSDRPQFRVRARLPDHVGTQSDEWFDADVEGVIERRVGEDQYRIGLQFMELDTEASALLEELVVGADRRPDI